MEEQSHADLNTLIETCKREINLSGGSPPDLFAVLKAVFSRYMDLDNKTSFMGVYILHKGILVLGPYVGPPTIHDLIPISTGVVGKCAATAEPLVIGDVTCCSFYLSCCESVKAEIVLPIKADNQAVVGVLDLDSGRVNAYSERDLGNLNRLVKVIVPACIKLADRVQLNATF